MACGLPSSRNDMIAEAISSICPAEGSSRDSLDNSLRILLIEDCAVDAKLLENAFDGRGARLERVATLAEGRQKLEVEDFDLVFLDLLLPDSHGLEKIAEIRSLAPETPIVVVSHVEDEALARKALHLGADDFVFKSLWNVSVLNRVAQQAMDRAHARKDLMRSERWMKALCNASRDGVLVEHAETIVFANRACAQLFGYGSVGELLGRRVSTLCASHDEQRLIAYGRQRELGKEVPQVYEFQGLRRDGSFLEAEASVSSFELQGRRYIITTIRDIEERKRADHSLRLAEFALDQAPDAITWLDFDGRYVYSNQAFSRLLDLSRQETSRMTVFDVDTSLSRPEWEASWRALRLGEEETIRTSLRKSGGEQVPVEIRTTRIQRDGKEYCLALTRDISTRLREEEALRQAKQLESIGRLAGGVAHDFNNLLMVIRGYSEVLKEELQESSQRSRVDEILAATNRAADLTRQLLTVGRRQVRRLEALDLKSSLTTFKTSLPGILTEHITTKVTMDSAPVVVRMDPDNFNRMLLNLVMNARDAMPDRGTLSLDLKVVTLESEKLPSWQLADAEQFVELAVRDTGNGIPPEALPHIFEPFFTTKERGKGTGLGLAVVYAIVKQAGGHIIAESTPGNGAAFRIWLPRISGEKTLGMNPGRAGAHVDIPRGSETILLVEDEEPLRKLALGALQRLGYTVLAASGGDEALQMAAQCAGQIDVLLTDVIMPGMNGRQTAEALQAIRPTVKVLFMSGYSDQILAQRGCLAPGIDLLEKPFSKETLARRLRRVIEGGK